MRCFARALVPPPAVVGWLAPWVGALLALPAVGKARVLDDHVLELLARGGDVNVAEPRGADLFQFASGAPSDNLRLMSRGSLLPWWSDPELKITFFRPLSSLSHRLDYALWAERPELMYVHSLLWLVLLLVLVRALYARFEATAGAATLATWLYALNDANGAVVSWLCNRNALVSGVGVVATLLWHRRAREGHRPSRVLAPAALAFASFAGELGLSAWAFLVAHALVLERGPLARRCAALWPYALVTLLWAGAYLASGAGTRGSGVYLHPLLDPVALARALPERAALLLGAAFGPIPADLAFIGSGALLPAALALALVCLSVLAWVTRSALRHDRLLRFWWTGTLLAVLPVAASFPSDRLLLVINVGGMAIVARTLRACWLCPSPRPAGARALGAALLLVHGVLAPLLLPWRAQQMQRLGAASERAFACLDDIADLERRTVIVLGGPADLFVSYLQVERAARALAQPEHVYWVTNPGAALHVRRADERTLELEREGGFFTTPPEALYRGLSARLVPGQRLRLPELEARIESVDASGAPRRITLQLARALDAERYVFLELSGDTYWPVAASELGARRIAPAPGLIELLERAPATRHRSDPTRVTMNRDTHAPAPSAPPTAAAPFTTGAAAPSLTGAAVPSLTGAAAPSLTGAAPGTCVVCAARGPGIVSETRAITSNVRAFAHERFWVWRCAVCRSIHARDDVDLGHYYARYPFFELPLDWRLRAAYGEQCRRLEAAGLRRGERILDYGCGSGAFVRYLRSCGYDADGYDAYNARFADRSLLERRYACVLSQDVLEHVVDPGALLDTFTRLAAPGGLIAIGTPNASAIDLARADSFRHTLHAPYHRHIFSRAALTAAGERRGWALQQYYPTQYANTLIPFLNSRFYLFFMSTLDDTLDCLLEQPPRVAPCLARWPAALAWGLCGAYHAEETDVMAVFRVDAGPRQDA